MEYYSGYVMLGFFYLFMATCTLLFVSFNDNSARAYLVAVLWPVFFILNLVNYFYTKFTHWLRETINFKEIMKLRSQITALTEKNRLLSNHVEDLKKTIETLVVNGSNSTYDKW